MQKLADKINERFGNEWEARDDRCYMHIWAKPRKVYDPPRARFASLGNDLGNAEFIVWGLERLSELGFFWSVDNLRLCTSEGKFRVICVRGSSATVDISAPGETVAEAVYNALCKALEVEL